MGFKAFAVARHDRRRAVAPIGASFGIAMMVVATSFTPSLANPEADPDASAAQRIPEAEWRKITSGKTLYYQIPGGLMGREYYVPSSNRSIFIYSDGTCFDGSWSWRDGIYCFLYDDEHCFEHLRNGDRIFVREMDGDEQDVIRITNEVLSCDPDLLSSLSPDGSIIR